MRVAIVVLSLMALAATAYAADPRTGGRPFGASASGQAASLEARQGEFYCQPARSLWLGVNASSAYGSELADDVPGSQYGHYIYGVSIFIVEWAADWVDPSGVTVNFYSGQCAPDTIPYDSRYLTWGNSSEMISEFIDDDGYHTVYRATMWICPPVFVDDNMSIGFQVDTSWGQESPYTGVEVTEDDDLYGCGGGYADHDHWGNPRWTPISIATIHDSDVAFCLIEDVGPSAAEETSWSSIKSLYR